jgi:endonuclease/exonuclease/phosphatase family metal-dependent hydrolase
MSVVAQRSPAAARGFRVMTYNIKHGQSNAPCTQRPALPEQPPLPDCSLNLAGSIAAMRAQAPDIVALQEIDRFRARSGNVDQPAVIADGLGMKHHCFGPNRLSPDRHAPGPHQYGTAIVSRFPILECSNTSLTTFEGWEQRGLLEAVIEVHGVPTRIYSTHLQASLAGQSGAPQRVLQVQDIMKRLSQVTEPVVLMGDFNAVSTSDEMKPLYTRLVDVWQKAGTGPGNTSSARPASDPSRRIDYIFTSPGVIISSVSVPIDKETRLASDHYPVVSDLALPAAQRGNRHVEALAFRPSSGSRGTRPPVALPASPWTIPAAARRSTRAGAPVRGTT